MTIKLHQLTLTATNKDNSTSGIVGVSMLGGNVQGQNGSNGQVFESYLVNALKKQNRELRSELDEKSATIDKLKKDIKLTRSMEMEIEL